MGPFLILLAGVVAAGGIGMVYNAISTEIIGPPTPPYVPPPPTPSPSPPPTEPPTPVPVTSIRISLSDPFDIRARQLSRIVEHFFGLNFNGRPDTIWRIDPRSATDNYNGTTQRAIHHFVPGNMLRDAFFRELDRLPSDWRHLVQMLRAGVDSLRTAPRNQLTISSYEIDIANWALDLFDERVRAPSTSIYEFEHINQGLDTLFRLFFWSPFNLFIGPLPDFRQPADPGRGLDVLLMPIMTLERSNRLRNLHEYVASRRDFDRIAVTDYISLTSMYTVPTSAGPWRPLSRTLDNYFRELVRISRSKHQPALNESIEYLSQNEGLVMHVKEQFRFEVIEALRVCQKCRNAVRNEGDHNCKLNKCPFFTKKMNKYYILDSWSIMRDWIRTLLEKTSEEVTPRFSMPDDVVKKYLNCYNDKDDDGSGSCPSLQSLSQSDDVTQDIEHYDRAFQKTNPDIEFRKMKQLPNRYLQPLGNPLVMGSLAPVVVNCLALLHHYPGMVKSRSRRSRFVVDENDIDVKYNSEYLFKLVELISEDLNRNVDELTIFKHLVGVTTWPVIGMSFDRVCPKH